MTILFTPEELVQYLYNETSPQKAAAIELALQQNWTLREKFEVLKASYDCLEKKLESPRTEAILRVMKYARDTQIETV